MERVRLNVLGLSNSTIQSNAYVLVLSDEEDEYRIPIVIGVLEAQSITILFEGIKTQRPLTHDIIKALTESMNVTLKEVFIYRLDMGIFYSELLFEGAGEEIKIDSRTSDAIALALKYACPIYTTREIIEKAGIHMPKEEKIRSELRDDLVVTRKERPKTHTVKELKALMEEAIKREDYEMASKYRDMLSELEK